MDANSSPTPLYTRLNAACNSRAALLFAFLWGLAEGTLFFIVPDVCLGLIALFNWRRGLLATACALAGAILGGVLMYALADQNPAGMNQVLLSIPLIHMDMVDSARSQLQAGGLGMMVTGPKQGIPYKVYAVQAGILGLPLLQFALMTIPARLVRFLPEVLALGLGGSAARKFFKTHPGLVVGIYAAVWGSIYFGYYLRFR